MKAYYAVHSDKTHVQVDSLVDFVARFGKSDWEMVVTDSDGWIPHTGTECPLPDGVLCEVKLIGSEDARLGYSERWEWTYTPSMGKGEIVAYRPILTEKVQEPEPTKPKRLFDDLLERLEASHNAEQALPDLVAQLRDRLKPLGLGVMYLSEFDAVQPEPAVETPQDKSDWRNWREGDEVTVFIGASKLLRTIIRILPDDDKQPIEVKDFSGNTSFPYWYQIKWHSRPAKGEK